MKRILKRTLSVILMMIMVGACLSLSANAEQTDYDENGEMNLDVVFVLDASGSMRSSDPDKIAVDAFNLFVDLCDESCGVGYSVYTEELVASSQIVSLDDEKNLAKLKKNISDIEYTEHGSTDIALGLTKAMDIHAENQSSENEPSDTIRKKAIILLSDGNTYLSSGSRTLAESNKEMESTLQSLNNSGIPVYSIGLNYDGTLDREELEKISDKTNGKSYETDTSDDLISIISDIFSDIYKLDGTNCEIIEGNVEINVKDNSVFYINVIIKTNLTVEELNPILTSPDGKDVSLTDSDNVKMTNTGSYTLIKLIYPDIGTWNLHLDNADENNCKITQLDFYSIYIKQKIQSNAVIGDTIKIEASLNEGNSIVDDYDLLKTITMTAVVSNENGDDEIALIRESTGVYTGEFTADIEGEYTVKTIAASETFEKESEISTVTVTLTPVESGTDEESDEEPNIMAIVTIVLIIVGVAIIIAVIAIIAITIARSSAKPKHQEIQPAPENNVKPVPKPEPPMRPSPKPTDPDYVNIPLIEHGDLESLIKKGPDDAFNANADNYKADPALEALIKKGPDNPFRISNDPEESDEKTLNLEKDELPTDDDSY